MHVYDELESEVRSYCRQYPVEFVSAKGPIMRDKGGSEYLDFFSGCGALNYGHNDDDLKKALLQYIGQDGIAMTLDMRSSAKTAFLEAFNNIILQPRSMDYRVQFTGPTGTNSVEAAIKLARKITGRTSVVAFTNGFHGCSLGALSLTGSGHHRQAAAIPLGGVTRHYYDGYMGSSIDTAALLDSVLSDPSSGIDKPAAIILESIQGEGGLNCASSQWLQGIARVAKQHGSLLILDDIQAGCGRSGSFFSTEKTGIQPDIITLSKSLSGFGLPMAVVLMKPELDIWKPGEHNGTFRGNNHAFVTAAAALTKFWSTPKLQNDIAQKSKHLKIALEAIARQYGCRVKGRGMMLGIDTANPEIAAGVRRKCFEKKLIIDLCGPNDEVIKLFPALTISRDLLDKGVSIIGQALSELRP